MANYTAVGQTELANHIPEIMVRSANEGLDYLRKYLNLARTVRKDYSGDFASRGTTLDIPVRGTLSVNDKTAKTNVTVQAPDDDVVQVVLNKHKEVTFLIEDVAKAVSIPNVLESYIRDAVAVIAEQVEQDIADEYENAGTTIALSSFDGWKEALVRARRELVTNKLPKFAPMFVQLDEYAVEEILNESGIEDASQFGNNKPLLDASVTKLAGINLFESQVVGVDTDTSPDTYYPFVYGSDALVLAVRPLPDWGNGNGVSQMTVQDAESGLAIRSTIGYDKSGLGLQCTLDILYGIKTIRPELMVAISHQPAVDA
jgi:hypothetical protein